MNRKRTAGFQLPCARNDSNSETSSQILKNDCKHRLAAVNRSPINARIQYAAGSLFVPFAKLEDQRPTCPALSGGRRIQRDDQRAVQFIYSSIETGRLNASGKSYFGAAPDRMGVSVH